MRAFYHSMLLVIVCASQLWAQPREGGAGQRRGGPAAGNSVASPVIEADRHVTFRVRAPEAKAVALASDFYVAETPLVKGDDGVWSVTVGPLDPDIYYYSFTIDGMKVLDPSNPARRSVSQRARSPAFWTSSAMDPRFMTSRTCRTARFGSIGTTRDRTA